MGFSLQFTLGLVLILSTCGSPTSANHRQVRQVTQIQITNNATSSTQNVTEINNRDINKIEKNHKKTEINSKHITSNLDAQNSVKLSKSEPYNKHNSSKETNSAEQISKNEVEKEREESARSIDIDVDRYISREFHSENNVFTLSPSSDAFFDDRDFEFDVTTHHQEKYEISSELTTPRTDFFDQKYKETVQNVDRKFENNRYFDDEDDDSKGLDTAANEPKNNTNIEYVKTKSIINNNTIDKNSIHKDTNVEETRTFNLESSYNETKTFDDTTEKAHKGDKGTTESTTPKNNFILTTRKMATFTKPSNNKNNSHILSNTIESETIKAINNIITTSQPIISIRYKSETENTTFGKIASTTVQSTTKAPVEDPIQENQIVKSNATLEQQVIQENQIIPVLLDAPKDSKSVESSTIETTTIETPETSSSKIDSSTASYFEATTIKTTEKITTEDTTIITDATKAATISQEESSKTTTEALINEKEADITTEQTTMEVRSTETGLRSSKAFTFDVPSSTEELQSTTESVSDTTVIATTEEEIESTTNTLVITSTVSLKTTTTESEKPSTSIPEDDPSHLPTSTTFVPSTYTNILTSTEHAASTPDTNISTLTEHEASTLGSNISTSTEHTGSTLGTNISTSTEHTTSTVGTNISTSTEHTASIVGTNISTTTEHIVVPLSTVAVNILTSTESVTQNEEPATTEFTFIHIETIDSNHTTLLPEILNPNYNYPTSEIVGPVDIRNKDVGTTTTESTLNVTAEEDPQGTFTASTEGTFKNGDDDKKGKIAAIVISTVGAVCLMLLAGLLYIMRKRQKRFNYKQRCKPVNMDDYSMDNVSVYNSVRRKGIIRASKRSYGNPAFEDPTAVTHPLNFPALAKFATNLEDIKAEFEEVPQISARTSELPDGCEPKNRYANVIPLPESRVFLKSIDGYPNSDYINANFVTGPKNAKCYYIATQAPMQNTVDDFWRMVWEQQTKVILMITHLFENGVEKCVDYLPPSEVLDCNRLFGDFQITLKKRDVKEKYIISSLQLKNMVSNSWREVTHFWYLGWPEKGVPTEGNSLIAFLIEARSFMKSATLDNKKQGNMQNGAASSQNEINPVVVHCSPGTGRTGVVIACDIAIREFEQSRLVDIPKIVYRIRRDRASAVQTKEQYQFIYKVISLYATKLTGGALDSF